MHVTYLKHRELFGFGTQGKLSRTCIVLQPLLVPNTIMMIAMIIIPNTYFAFILCQSII